LWRWCRSCSEFCNNRHAVFPNNGHTIVAFNRYTDHAVDGWIRNR
jgi:hypothetical protein